MAHLKKTILGLKIKKIFSKCSWTRHTNFGVNNLHLHNLHLHLQGV